jgi:hypothetical protein
MCAQTYRVMTYFNGTTSAPPPPGVIAQSRSGYLVTTSDDEESSSVGEAFRVTTSGALTTLHLFSAAEPNRPFSVSVRPTHSVAAGRLVMHLSYERSGCSAAAP